MKFKEKLIKATFLKRYKRFFADVKIESKVVVAHVPNTGSLKSANNPGQDCLVSPAENQERKLKFTLQAIRATDQKTWIGVNTTLPNQLIKEIFIKGQIPQWKKYVDFQSEVKINPETRLDLLLIDKQGKKNFIEIKNVTLADKGVAKFPDAKTERGQKHLLELMKLKDQGHAAEIVFVINRNDCHQFTTADDIDPEYGKLLRQAAEKGVKIRPLLFVLDENEIEFSGKELPYLTK